MKILKYTILLYLISVVSAEIKIGYVDSNQIMSSFDEVRQVQIDLEKEQPRLENEFNLLLAQLDSLQQDYERQRLLMSEQRRSEKENEILNMKKSAEEFQMRKFGPEGEIYRKQNELLKPVLKKIDEAIQKVGSEQGYDFIENNISPEQTRNPCRAER